MKLNKPYTNKQYAELAIYCNQNNCHIEDKEDYLEAVSNPPAPEPTYAQKRINEYPLIGDQLDMIYWDIVNGTSVWKNTISAVKEKYPKPTVSNPSTVEEEEVLDELVETEIQEETIEDEKK